ncbi:NADH-cytochrome b5 reductase 1 [Capsicum annuum]|nr:NADH-cytochrome b5 reductase 1 [Capsicum annuum]
MSQHFARLKPGDVLQVKGPIEKLRYSPNLKKHIGMIAGGSGITPMLQVIEAILKNPDDNTQVSLVYANLSPDDILLKKKLDVLAATHPNLKVFYTVDNPTNDWRGSIGYVSKDMIIKGLPPPGDDTLILCLFLALGTLWAVYVDPNVTLLVWFITFWDDFVDEDSLATKMPEAWRWRTMIPVYKNKGDIQSCNNYRGIKLTHSMKVWERVVELRMRRIMTISENQFGFMSGRSTTVAIHLVRRLVEQFWERKKDLHMMFIDLEKIYDRVLREIL